MMRAMFSAVSGLRNHQTMMDNLSSNISNVNTFGYKSSRTTFQDTLYQTLGGAAAATGPTGGTNPQQIGLGMRLSSIDNLMTQGAVQNTAIVTDVSVQGDGFFRVSTSATTFAGADKVQVDGDAEAYTRAGNFSFDAEGYLVTQGGDYVIGRNPADTATIRMQVDPADTPRSVTIDSSGVLSYITGAGTTVTVGTLSLATFPNQSGLLRQGDNQFIETPNSGTAVQGAPGGTTGAGTVSPGTLEMSNVDLAQELTQMIIAQRGFQANGRAITTSDEMLNELVNLKR